MHGSNLSPFSSLCLFFLSFHFHRWNNVNNVRAKIGPKQLQQHQQNKNLFSHLSFPLKNN